MAWRLLAWAAGTACRFGDAAEASRHAIEHAQARGRRPPGAARGDGLRRRSRARADPRRRGDRPLRGSDGADRGRPPVGGGPPRGAVAASTRCRASSITRARSRREAGPFSRSSGLQMETARLGMDAGTLERLAGEPRRRPCASSGRPTTLSTLSARGSRSRPSRASSRRPSSSRQRWKRRARSATGAATSRPKRISRPRRSGATSAGRILARQGAADRGGGDRRRSHRAARCDRRDRVPDRVLAWRSARPSPPAARSDEARDAYESARALAEKKGGVVILTGVLRRLEDLDAAPATRERLGHQFQGPLIGASATTVQILGVGGE